MLYRIIVWSLGNRLLVLLGAAALLAIGGYSASQLNVEAYPDPTPPLLAVITQKPGATPEEVERLITIPLETALNGMPGLEFIRSTSIAGLSDVKCQFAYGANYSASRQEVLNRIGMVDLPAGVQPELSPWSPTGEIVRYVLEGPGYTPSQLKSVQDWVLNRALKQVPGVLDVVGFGGSIKQYQVLPDPRILRHYEITLAELQQAIAESNANVGGDVLTLGNQSHNVRAIGLLGEGIDPLDPDHVDHANEIEQKKVDDIGNVVVTTTTDGTPVLVKQVAQVVVGHQPRLGQVGRGRENDVVEGIVMMRKGDRSLVTAHAVAAKMEEIQSSGLLPRGMAIKVFNQRTDLVHITTHNVLHNLLVGVGLVIAVLFVFLGNAACASIVALTIPLALLFAISILYLNGMSANLLSIGAVDFGIIVDSSVIIVERVYRRLSTEGRLPGVPLTEQIARACHDIDRPILFSSVIIVCAFLPLFTLSGPAGALFSPMAATYAFSILGALLVSVTVSPVLCSLLLRRVSGHETPVDRLLKASYGRLLPWSLSHRWLTVALSAALLAFTGSLVPRLGSEFMPQLEEGNLWIRAVLPRTVSREEAARIAPKLREVIASVPEVRGVMSHLGRPDDGTDVTGFYNLEFNVPLRPMEEWRPGLTRRAIEAELSDKFRQFPGVDFGFSQLIRDNIDEALSGIKGSNSVKLFGNDLVNLEQLGQRIVEQLRTVNGVQNASVFSILRQPNLEIRIDRPACARHGVSVKSVEDLIEVAIAGKSFTQIVEGEKRYDVVLRLPEDQRSDPESIARISLDVLVPQTAAVKRIPLSELTVITPHKSGASCVYRENNRRYIPIKFAVAGRDLGSVVADAQRMIAANHDLQLPPGYRMEWSGEFAQMKAATASLGITVPLSIGLVFLVLYLMFRSLVDSLLVMAGVLTALTGGVGALYLTGTAFSISAAVGFISIFGVVVQNGVLLVSSFNRLRDEGSSTGAAVLEGSLELICPVVMISLTAILGLLPAAVANSVGSQAQKPLAIVVVGGMLSAMILPQFVIPALYTLCARQRKVVSLIPDEEGPHASA